MIAPAMPVIATVTAVSEGKPPIFSAIPMAIGIVADFGASDSSVSVEAPNAHPIATAEPIAVIDPSEQCNRHRHQHRL